MNISKQSAIYKFMDESWVLERECVPTNLCPFMRRFLFGLGMTFFLYWLIILTVGSMISAPFFLFVDNLSDGQIVATIIGLILDGFLFFWLIAAAVDATPLPRKLKGAVNKVKQVSTISLFVAWAKAVHDKVCPSVSFSE